jgi:ABC-2 type transport system ATP-binding protein
VDTAIETHGVTKAYRGVEVLRGVDLSVRSGSVHALLGPNGAGKTTLVRILATLATADGGRASVAGYDIVRQRRQVRRTISLTGQYAAVDDVQTGRENLRMMGRLLGLSPKDARGRADAMLRRFDLVDAGDRRVGTYSGGMRRRLDLAASLVGRPAVIFLDEPTTGLDLPSRQAMWQVVAGLADSGVTVLLTTQYLEEADLLADRIAVLDQGRIIADGTAADLKQQVAEQRLDLVATDAAGYARLRARAADARIVATEVDAATRTLGVPTDGTAPHVRALLDILDANRDDVASFTIHSATLDDVFLALTGRPTAPADTIDPTHIKETARV